MSFGKYFSFAKRHRLAKSCLLSGSDNAHPVAAHSPSSNNGPNTRCMVTPKRNETAKTVLILAQPTAGAPAVLSDQNEGVEMRSTGNGVPENSQISGTQQDHLFHRLPPINPRSSLSEMSAEIQWVNVNEIFHFRVIGELGSHLLPQVVQ